MLALTNFQNGRHHPQALQRQRKGSSTKYIAVPFINVSLLPAISAGFSQVKSFQSKRCRFLFLLLLFSPSAAEALEKNKELITENQREYQKELERNFMEFRKDMEPILGKNYQHRGTKRGKRPA